MHEDQDLALYRCIKDNPPLLLQLSATMAAKITDNSMDQMLLRRIYWIPFFAFFARLKGNDLLRTQIYITQNLLTSILYEIRRLFNPNT